MQPWPGSHVFGDPTGFTGKEVPSPGEALGFDRQVDDDVFQGGQIIGYIKKTGSSKSQGHRVD